MSERAVVIPQCCKQFNTDHIIGKKMARLDSATSLGMERFHLVRLTRLEARKRRHLCPEVSQPDAINI
jgi:hypothetical protein